MNWSVLALPAMALFTGAVAFGYMWLQSRDYDHKHPLMHPPAGE
ncbi:hypothetical protein [Lichenihabitans sp. PAMC28606]|nr:hypothetical protein [Lichenihabitans sp. PAMC28606]